MELGSSPVEAVMTPRTEIFSLPLETPIPEARTRAREAGFSKIPIAAGAEPDEVAGLVTALDLLLAEDEAPLESLIRETVYVPEVKPALELLEEFQASGRRLAFAVDEHGHLSGLVTPTDLLEEISGEMIERGDLHKVLYRRVAKNRVVIPARMEIRFFNEEFSAELEASEAETMAGLLLEHTGRIPEQGEEFQLGRISLRVLKAEPNRVVTIEAVFSEVGSQEEEGRS
jgi:CBS domain containing-hemolysin-like protein